MKLDRMRSSRKITQRGSHGATRPERSPFALLALAAHHANLRRTKTPDAHRCAPGVFIFRSIKLGIVDSASETRNYLYARVPECNSGTTW